MEAVQMQEIAARLKHLYGQIFQLSGYLQKLNVSAHSMDAISSRLMELQNALGVCYAEIDELQELLAEKQAKPTGTPPPKLKLVVDNQDPNDG